MRNGDTIEINMLDFDYFISKSQLYLRGISRINNLYFIQTVPDQIPIKY